MAHLNKMLKSLTQPNLNNGVVLLQSGTLLLLVLLSSCVTHAADISMKISSPTRFEVCNKTAEKIEIPETQSENITHIVTQLSAYSENNCTRVLQGTQFPDNIQVSTNGFVQTVINAYNGHHNLFIRPDDIWTAILTQFSFYLNANAEKFRGQFVNFTGQKELVVKMNGTSLEDASYDGFVNVMIDEIHKNLVDDEVKNWVIPDFTTTKPNDIVTNGVILMATLKHYFKYTGVIGCGIPHVTLDGSVEDWKKIQRKLKKLRDYKLSKWVDMLEPVLEQFIKAKSGTPDTEFWEEIIYYENVNVVCGFVNYISGWITTFAAFDGNGDWQGSELGGSKLWPRLQPSDIPSGIVEVNVSIVEHDVLRKTVMFAGHMASQSVEDGYTLQPRSGWAIALKPDN